MALGRAQAQLQSRMWLVHMVVQLSLDSVVTCLSYHGFCLVGFLSHYFLQVQLRSYCTVRSKQRDYKVLRVHNGRVGRAGFHP